MYTNKIHPQEVKSQIQYELLSGFFFQIIGYITLKSKVAK